MHAGPKLGTSVSLYQQVSLLYTTALGNASLHLRPIALLALATRGRMMVAYLPLVSALPIAAPGDGRKQSRPSQEQSLESLA